MTVRFGTDGIRGVAGVFPVTLPVACAVGRAASRLAGGGTVVVGWDTRPSSADLAAAVAAGAAREGSEVEVAGVVPTSAVGVALHRGLGAAGVMVTASHNPAGENGFKMFGRGGSKPDDDLAARIEGWIALVLADPAPHHVAPPVGPGVLAAWESAMDAVFAESSPLVGRRVAIDLANGAATAVIPWLRRLPVDWRIVGDGTGLPNEGVGSEHPEAVARVVRAERCDAGFAVDGDADRCVVIDERGRSVAGDALAWLLARDLRVEALAVTVMSNGALEPALPGVRVVRTAVGDRHVRAAMDQGGLRLGAEESGHVLFGDFPAGDGILTGLRALGAAWRARPSLSAAVAEFVPLPRRLSRVRVGLRRPLDQVGGLGEEVAAAELRLGPGGRVFLRYSGTEPVLRILVEGRDDRVVEEVAARIGALAARELG